MKKGIVTLGEILIDFLPTNNTNLVYEKKPGGAPANVAVGVSRLGSSSTFISKVGKDSLGLFLKDVLKQNNVNTNYVLETKDAKTNIVLVNLDNQGERDFEFFVNPSADQLLNEEDIKEEAFHNKKIFHFGSITLIQEPSLSATKKAIKLAKKNNLLISYDPNIRISLWENAAVAKVSITSVLSYADILKVSKEELEFIAEEKNIEKAAALLSEKYNIAVIFVTDGSAGSYVFIAGAYGHAKALNVNVIDTTGAGDSFMSAVLYKIDQFEEKIEDINIDIGEEIIKFANIAGAIATTAKGGMSTLPTKEEIDLRRYNER